MLNIIVNPVSGKGQSIVVLKNLKEKLDQLGRQYNVKNTSGPMDAYNLANDACKSGSEGIIAIGGDGTLQEIVAAMHKFYIGEETIPIPLGILPCGSGNDFALTFRRNGKNKKKPGKKIRNMEQVEACAASIAKRELAPVDLINISGDMVYQAGQLPPFNETICINIANIGLDSRIVANAASLKQRFGRHAYLAAAYKSIAQHKNIPMTITADGNEIKEHLTLLAICNGQYYGGGMRISPEAKLNDGEITLCLVGGISRLKTMAIFPSVIFERHTKLKFVRFINCKELSLEAPDGEVLAIDGNLVNIFGKLNFTILPNRMSIYRL